MIFPEKDMHVIITSRKKLIFEQNKKFRYILTNLNYDVRGVGMLVMNVIMRYQVTNCHTTGHIKYCFDFVI